MAGALRLPEHFTERFHEHMFGTVQIAVSRLECAVQFPHAGRPVCRNIPLCANG